MSIASKLSYLNETKELLKNKINDLGGNIDDNDTFRSYVDFLDNIYKDYPKVEGEGTNITLENTNIGKIQTILKGQNYQITSENEPSPDYPQPIESVQGLQNIKIEDKNLFSDIIIGQTFRNQSDRNRALIYGKILPNTSYTISFGDNTGIDGLHYFEKANKEDDTITYGTKLITTTTTKTTQNNSNWIGIQINKTNVTLEDVKNIKLQLEKGNTASSYVEHNEQNYNVNLNNIQINENEYIFKNEISSEHYDSNLDLDAYYYYKLKNKVIFDGTENWKFGTGNVFYVDNVTNYATSNNIPMSNYFKGITNVTGEGDGAFVTNDNVIAFINISGATTPRFYICSSKFNSNVNTLKTWLTTHNIEVLYNQNVGEYIKITNENLINNLNNLETAKSYDDTTLISTNGNLPVILNAKALMKGV